MTLNRQSWVEAARDLMSQKSVDAVKVEVLARNLNVSKGSFYWHFKNRDELLDELLAYWETVTDELIDYSKEDSNPKGQLSRLFFAIAEAGVSGEESIHIWAKRDQDVADTVRHVEAKRMAYLQAIFEQAGFPERAARERAEITYLAFLGYAFKLSQDSAFNLSFTDLGKEIITIMFKE